MIPLLMALACTPKTPPADQAAPSNDAVIEPAVEPAPVEPEADCKPLGDGRTACFPAGHVCSDPHGIGDGKAIVVDCWTSGGRMCHPASEIWPECAGGWIQAG